MSPRLRRGVLLTGFVLLGLCAAGFDGGTHAARSGLAAPGGQYQPALAFDGTNMLTVWEDIRFSDSIAGARVSPEGTILDPEEIRIAVAPNLQRRPDVAFGGQNYLVAWDDERSTVYRDVYAARVSPDGIVLDPDGIPISTGGCCRFSPAVAFGSGNYLVVWVHPAELTDIRGARVSPDGVVLDETGFPISSAAGWQWTPAVATDGADYLVVWWDQRSTDDIYGTPVTGDGLVADPAGILISSGQGGSEPAIAFGDENYLIVWEDDRGNGDVYGARVTPSGVVLDPEGIPIATGSSLQITPSVAFDGVNYMVAWDDRRNAWPQTYVARVTPAGEVLEPEGIRISGPTSQFFRTCVRAFELSRRLGGRAWRVRHLRLPRDACGIVVDPNGFLISTGTSLHRPHRRRHPSRPRLCLHRHRRRRGPPPPPPPPAPPPPATAATATAASAASSATSATSSPATSSSTSTSTSTAASTSTTCHRRRRRRSSGAGSREWSASGLRPRAQDPPAALLGRPDSSRPIRAQAGRVISQSPRAGFRRPRGAKVNLVSRAPLILARKM